MRTADERSNRLVQNAPGRLEVVWVQRAAPWVAYRVLVDGNELDRVHFGRPAAIMLQLGRHSIVVKHWRFRSNVVSIDVSTNLSTTLYSGTRTPPRGQTSFRKIFAWYSANSIWLSEIASPPDLQSSDNDDNLTGANVPISRFRGLVALASVFVFGALALGSAVSGNYLRMFLALPLTLSGISITIAWVRRRAR
jgi:hypothetical protein